LVTSTIWTHKVANSDRLITCGIGNLGDGGGDPEGVDICADRTGKEGKIDQEKGCFTDWNIWDWALWP
jgi:hypothetical protein